MAPPVVYLLFAVLRVLLGILRFSQQVWKGEGFERARARRSGIPERITVPCIPSTAHGAERARAHASRRVNTVYTDHGDCLGPKTRVLATDWSKEFFVCPEDISDILFYKLFILYYKKYCFKVTSRRVKLSIKRWRSEELRTGSEETQISHLFYVYNSFVLNV